MMNKPKKKAAHFLLLAYLQKSPPNDALFNAYKELDVDVDFYAPDVDNSDDPDQPSLAIYGFKWLFENLFNKRWRQYDYFSCTSEDPIVIAGLFSFIYRKPLIFLSDEIKSGSYRGNRPERWKKMCRWAMRRAKLTIVNDESRISLQREYAALTDQHVVTVYPGCFLKPPSPIVPENKPTKAIVMAYSGSFTISGGVPWALQALHDLPNINLLVQPLGVSELNQLLLSQHALKERIEISQRRLNWQESWQSMGGVDIGIAIYNNDKPQFQKMGISSNRLCMFIAMGVPVITSKQDSFQFIEEYNCGVMVSNQEEYNAAVIKISSNLAKMKRNALRCADEYINCSEKYDRLVTLMRRL